jgi:tetratricopeptide (TPR) repeat protein
MMRGKKISYDRLNRYYAYVIWSFYCLLISFAIISVSSPDWLMNLSQRGQISEASTMKEYGNYFLNLHDYDMAITQYKRAILINPDMAEAYINMGVALMHTGNHRSALENLEKALEYDDVLHDVTYFTIGDILTANNKPEMAFQYYLKAAEAAPFPLRAYQKAGELLNNTRQWDAAADLFEKALIHANTMKNVYYGSLKRDYYIFLDEKVKERILELKEKGIENTDFSAWDEQAFNDALTRCTRMAGIYNQYGYTHAMRGNYAEALRYFTMAVDTRPDFQEAVDNLNAAEARLKSQTIF